MAADQILVPSFISCDWMLWLLQPQHLTGSGEAVSVLLTWKHVKNAQLQTPEVANRTADVTTVY